MMISHLYFYKHNKYPLNEQKEAFEKVYDNVQEMKSYVYGIAISQFLWSTHYAMYSFFINEIQKKNKMLKITLKLVVGMDYFCLKLLKDLRIKLITRLLISVKLL